MRFATELINLKLIVIVISLDNQGSLVPGKINPSHSSLYISYGGQEVAKKHYEVLVQVKSQDS